MPMVTTPDEIYDTYVEINKDKLLDINVYNDLIQKLSYKIELV